MYPGPPCFVACSPGFCFSSDPNPVFVVFHENTNLYLYKASVSRGILQDERSPTCLLSLEKWDKKMQRRGNCVLLPSDLPPSYLLSHQPREKARTRRLPPSSSPRPHSGIRLIQSVGENLLPLLLYACPSTWLLLSISWSISDSCYIWAERRQFILARPVHI